MAGRPHGRLSHIGTVYHPAYIKSLTVNTGRNFPSMLISTSWSLESGDRFPTVCGQLEANPIGHFRSFARLLHDLAMQWSVARTQMSCSGAVLVRA